MSAQQRMLQWYRDSFKQYGKDDFRSLTWGDKKGLSAKARYDQMNNIVNFKNKSIIEFGCGWGSFFDFGFHSYNYLGVDINPEFIGVAKKKYKNHTFKVGDILEDTFFGEFDIAISSGVAGNQGGPADHPIKLYNFLSKMLSHASMVLVNFPSTWATIRTPNIEYFCPSSTLQTALTLTTNVQLYHKERADFLLILSR